MSKVVIFKGSPRKNGYTAKLLEQVAKGAGSKGADIIEFDLNDPGIRGCQGCFYCRTHDGCAVKDYLQPMYEAIAEADAIVFGSPIYYYQITGQARVWLDRTFPMLGVNFAPRHPGKKLITIFAQGNPDPKIGAEGIKFANDVLETYGWKLEDSIHCCGTNADPDSAMFEELSLRAFQDGEKLIG
ncbi:flavodoxin family protein [Clostridium sp. Marseille-P2415]|uniref:flavodoxin family protein n=1 Tax=Clostridium sp. Marseille-P2415 TaxID=1805471 RepID=UPI0009885F7E|nr:flavodoxin family protein [Clostridium sp. Marseille-P2415]